MNIENSSPAWLVGKLRMTVFADLDSELGQVMSWKDLCGELPEEESHKPRQHSYRASGPLLNGSFSLEAKPGRLDVVLSAVPRDETTPFFNLGLFRDVQAQVSPLFHQWLKGNSVVLNRLAFGAELVFAVGSLDDGLDLLDNQLSSVNVPRDTVEFTYAINRRVSYEASESIDYLNRLATWKLLKMQALVGELRSGGALTESGPEVTGISLALDVNTPASTRHVISPDISAELLNAAIAAAEAIARSGDNV